MKVIVRRGPGGAVVAGVGNSGRATIVHVAPDGVEQWTHLTPRGAEVGAAPWVRALGRGVVRLGQLTARGIRRLGRESNDGQVRDFSRGALRGHLAAQLLEDQGLNSAAFQDLAYDRGDAFAWGFQQGAIDG